MQVLRSPPTSPFSTAPLATDQRDEFGLLKPGREGATLAGTTGLAPGAGRCTGAGATGGGGGCDTDSVTAFGKVPVAGDGNAGISSTNAVAPSAAPMEALRRLTSRSIN